ncbi:uncharacterized protein ARMOST_14189 [Armillaria ostoyae]|uniref:DNA2/NAM7 helicase-like C-terminal domain-containing protein n=1 Tax=Armillaria ostoyae TaxID=47428 RepID=A0A284RQ32_ARMOS|nr:uncharacterized protein ARMOST_14189 [Armillaria ostoyae]
MPKLAICLCHHLIYDIRAIDLSTLRSKSPSNPYYPSELLSETTESGFERFTVDSLWNDRLNEAEGERIRKVSLRAWISAVIIKKNTSMVALTKPVETRWLSREVIVCLGHLLCQVDILEHAKPTQFSNDFTQVSKDSSGQLHDYNYRYNTRLRGSKHLVVVLKTLEGHEFKGSPAKAHGKRASINVSGSFHGTVTGVKVFGRERATNAEKAHDMLLLRALQGECHLSHSKFVRMLWFPSKDDEKYFLISDTQTSPVLGGNLNKSQRKVVSSMISARPLVLVHGPPGTGKPWTISAAAEIWGRSNLTTWIVAHSNIAVKNIAEKWALSRVDFKIVVSKEVYFEHGHIYTKVKDRLLRVDRLPKNQKDLRRTIGRSNIILSTLSMLSNPALDQNGMLNLVPPKSLVVDEASQINVFDYMNEMKQVCFFGDPKQYQMPPYGQDKAPLMQSIFDIDHLKDMAHMLDVQYRMPHPVGNFISLEAYNNQLRSENTIMDPSCIAFIDAKYGTEEKSGFSWRNYEEVRTIAHLVRLYYKDHDFCVITPYDAQRAAIEKELKRQTLPSEQVFNVDSFQGNEADIVLVSIVRFRDPGFLRSEQQMNVMLTRCRRGLVIVSSRSFLLGPGKSTLVGKLARGRPWKECTAVIEERANLPGARGEYAPAYYPASVPRRPDIDVKSPLPHREASSAKSGPSKERSHPPLNSESERFDMG